MLILCITRPLVVERRGGVKGTIHSAELGTVPGSNLNDQLSFWYCDSVYLVEGGLRYYGRGYP